MNRKVKHILPAIAVVCMAITSSCNNDLIRNPQAKLEIYTISALDSLVVADSVFANKTSLYFINSGQAFFSVVYPGNKVLKDSLTSSSGNDSVIWTSNYDYNYRNKPGHYDPKGKRAVKGITLEYMGKYNAFINAEGFTFSKAGTYTIVLEAINTNESGDTRTVTDTKTIKVY
ncbi:MAG: hypothetical protein JXB34_14455 [Bacteroidales bacterium]|nr:hypothetical protein [Bacteroidales bacterium]